jgi:predicted nucleic acid-binding protein
MSLESGFVDANVLIYSVNEDAPQHSSARALLASATYGSTTLSVNSQILCEFYSVVTNRRRVLSPRSSQEAIQALSEFARVFRVLPTSPQSFDILADLLRRRPVTGSDIFDLQIVAAMIANGIHRIYNFNAADFQPFSELEVIVP